MGKHCSFCHSGKKRSPLLVLAVVVAIIGGLVAVFAYLKKKAEDINEKLDFDGDLYFEDDDYFESSDPKDKNRNHCDCGCSDDELDDSEQAERLAQTLASDEEA